MNRHRGSLRTVTAPLLLGLVLVGAWQLLVSRARWPAFVLPAPADVAARLAHDLSQPLVWRSLGLTALEAGGGCAVGLLAALPLAVAIHESEWFSAAVNPFLGATQAIPAIALAPLLVLWIGYGLPAVVLLCALMVFFPILVSALLGLRHVDPEVVDAARMDGAGVGSLLAFIEAPLALPSVLAGLRNGFTLSITGAVVGEMVMGGNGMGQLLTVQRDQVDTVGMFSTLFVLCSVASAVYSLIRQLERSLRLEDSRPARKVLR